MAAGRLKIDIRRKKILELLALGDITTMDELRAVVRRSEAVNTYEPHHTPEWEAAYQKLLSFSK